MPREAVKDSGEKMQIAILTLAMTAGGFLLVTLFLFLYLNPGAKADADRSMKGYKDLTELLQGPEMKDLRRQAKRSEGQEHLKGLGEIVSEALGRHLLKFPRFPPSETRPGKPGFEVVRQPIAVDPAKLQDLLMFIADVQDAKKTIQVESAKFARDLKSKTEDDMWTLSAEFVDYVSKETAPGGAPPAEAPDSAAKG